MEEQQQEDPKDRKKRLQHEAYRRWYTSDKGKAYREANRQRAKEQNALREVK